MIVRDGDGPALQQWMALVLPRLLSLRAWGRWAIYAMHPRPARARISGLPNLAAQSGRKGNKYSFIIAAATSLAAPISRRLRRSVATHTSKCRCALRDPKRYEIATIQPTNRRFDMPRARVHLHRGEFYNEAVVLASPPAASAQQASSQCIRVDGLHWSSHRCSQPQMLSTWC